MGVGKAVGALEGVPGTAVGEAVGTWVGKTKGAEALEVGPGMTVGGAGGSV